jgi:hypothetical protein
VILFLDVLKISKHAFPSPPQIGEGKPKHILKYSIGQNGFFRIK